MAYEDYQPLWINGKTVGRGMRSCEDRYQSIADYLQGRKGFSLIDIGAHSGYFTVRLAEEFKAKAVALDGYPALVEALAAQGSRRVRAVHEYADPGLLQQLGDFDVGLCLSVLHHVDWWPQMLTLMSSQCTTLFVECEWTAEATGPRAQRVRNTIATVEGLGGKLLSTSPTVDQAAMRPLYVIDKS
ncbi:class I SAM-dependent methyltransferase [Streptomyces violascens]|uniref:class I SAM-dependent methyltransferase n=1 Tax=Streptomyces violascens TaxID=67381 RepID=UPI0036A81BC2